MSFNPKTGIVTSLKKIEKGEIDNLSRISKTEINYSRKNGEYVIIDQSLEKTEYPDRVTSPTQEWRRTKIWVFQNIGEVCDHISKYKKWERFFINTFPKNSHEWTEINKSIMGMKK